MAGGAGATDRVAIQLRRRARASICCGPVLPPASCSAAKPPLPQPSKATGEHPPHSVRGRYARRRRQKDGVALAAEETRDRRNPIPCPGMWCFSMQCFECCEHWKLCGTLSGPQPFWNKNSSLYRNTYTHNTAGPPPLTASTARRPRGAAGPRWCARRPSPRRPQPAASGSR